MRFTAHLDSILIQSHLVPVTRGRVHSHVTPDSSLYHELQSARGVAKHMHRPTTGASLQRRDAGRCRAGLLSCTARSELSGARTKRPARGCKAVWPAARHRWIRRGRGWRAQRGAQGAASCNESYLLHDTARRLRRNAGRQNRRAVRFAGGWRQEGGCARVGLASWPANRPRRPCTRLLRAGENSGL